MMAAEGLASRPALLGCGLILLASSQNLPMYIGAWIIMGFGMGAGLYDAAFATLGRLYSMDARRSIAALTLFGGFASTVCWLLTAFLLDHLGWRGACLVYGVIQLIFAVPQHWIVVPHGRNGKALAGPECITTSSRTALLPSEDSAKFLVAAAAITLASVISSMLAVHLLQYWNPEAWRFLPP